MADMAVERVALCYIQCRIEYFPVDIEEQSQIVQSAGLASANDTFAVRALPPPKCGLIRSACDIHVVGGRDT